MSSPIEEYNKKIASGEVERTKQRTPLEKWNDLNLEQKKRRPGWAVKAMCWECSSESLNEIRYCTAKSCPLYEIRPYQKKE